MVKVALIKNSNTQNGEFDKVIAQFSRVPSLDESFLYQRKDIRIAGKVTAIIHRDINQDDSNQQSEQNIDAFLVYQEI